MNPKFTGPSKLGWRSGLGLPPGSLTDIKRLVGPKAKETDAKEPRADLRAEDSLPRVPEDESINLGGLVFTEVNESGVPLVMSRPKPRGLLPVPLEVEAILSKEESRLFNEHGIVPTPEARQRLVNSFTLQYYYEGFYLAYRPTPQGPEVLAVGHEEIGQLLRGLDQEQRLQITVGQP
jgi:hypothetical protein